MPRRDRPTFTISDEALDGDELVAVEPVEPDSTDREAEPADPWGEPATWSPPPLEPEPAPEPAVVAAAPPAPRMSWLHALPRPSRRAVLASVLSTLLFLGLVIYAAQRARDAALARQAVAGEPAEPRDTPAPRRTRRPTAQAATVIAAPASRRSRPSKPRTKPKQERRATRRPPAKRKQPTPVRPKPHPVAPAPPPPPPPVAPPPPPPPPAAKQLPPAGDEFGL